MLTARGKNGSIRLETLTDIQTSLKEIVEGVSENETYSQCQRTVIHPPYYRYEKKVLYLIHVTDLMPQHHPIMFNALEAVLKDFQLLSADAMLHISIFFVCL